MHTYIDAHICTHIHKHTHTYIYSYICQGTNELIHKKNYKSLKNIFDKNR